MRGSLDDMAAFAAVARARSFTRAAAELGLSTSALSYTIKRLETRLGIPLLQRNSRSVAANEAGETLLRTLEPALETIGGALDDLGRARHIVSGTVRITATRQAYDAVIRPVLAAFCATYPAATVEVLIEYEFRDLIADRFDAGIRLGEKLQQDMIALSVGPELRMAVVAAPSYLAAHPAPGTPPDLTRHLCINYRMMAAGSLYAWEFNRNGRELEVKVAGPLTFNEPELMLSAAVEGLGVAYVLEHEAMPFIASGAVVRLLEDWTPTFPGFFLYYPSRRQVPPALAAFVSALRRHRRGGSS
ncbi:LysR family transcriptional regulator [Rhodopila sp.]|uniref:LysR family transcriptional regulator n=1 Tax=Rhodopila sp. TaxID=2480087 RepID=UPI003D0AB06D